MTEPYPDSLCHRCANRRYVRTRTSTFVMCTALPVKYPRQPVLACEAFQELQPLEDPAEDPPRD